MAIASDSLGVMALVNQLSQKFSQVKPSLQAAEFSAPGKLVTFHKIHAQVKIKEPR
jgi:acyl carrier protein